MVSERGVLASEEERAQLVLAGMIQAAFLVAGVQEAVALGLVEPEVWVGKLAVVVLEQGEVVVALVQVEAVAVSEPELVAGILEVA